MASLNSSPGSRRGWRKPAAHRLQDLLWRRPGWPGLHYNAQAVEQAIAAVRRKQGLVEGKLAAIGFDERQAIAADTWIQEALSTAAIEGERLDLEALRSSVARRLGVGQGTQSKNLPRHVDGLLDLMEDAVSRASEPLTHKRLYAWQAALFPSGYSGMTKIAVGAYRDHSEPMQIVSGPIGKETVHYEAPASKAVASEMRGFLDWINSTDEPNPLIKASIAHLWFETIHPFEDGNGRVGRAIVDWVLAQDTEQPSRVLRISQQLFSRRSDYYDQLAQAQHGTLDVTAWVVWFTGQVHAGFERASAELDLTLSKALFWDTHRSKDLNPRQRKAVNLLLDAGPGGFDGGLSTRKYENLTGAARATASRDLVELAAMGLLVPAGAGRSTRYDLAITGWQAQQQTAPNTVRLSTVRPELVEGPGSAE
jgi:Fic family protein